MPNIGTIAADLTLGRGEGPIGFISALSSSTDYVEIPCNYV